MTYYFINIYKNKAYYYYLNLGISKALLWTTILIFDIVLFLFLVLIIEATTSSSPKATEANINKKEKDRISA